MIKVGIVGNGYVGHATQLIKSPDIQYKVYDVDPKKCSKGVKQLKRLQSCDFIFLCLPTPMRKDGSCHTRLLSKTIKELRALKKTPPIVVRSTVPVGFCRRQKVHFMPEFLTEKNWADDVKNCENWIVGIYNLAHMRGETLLQDPFVWSIRKWFELAAQSDSIKESARFDFVTTDIAELAKLSRNVFLAVKVSFFNEIAEFCEHRKINYQALRPLIGGDPRIGDSHTYVPGPDGKHGYGGTCFPKDISSLVHQMKKTPKMQMYITDAALNRNLERDRPDHDWEERKGRAVV